MAMKNSGAGAFFGEKPRRSFLGMGLKVTEAICSSYKRRRSSASLLPFSASQHSKSSLSPLVIPTAEGSGVLIRQLTECPRLFPFDAMEQPLLRFLGVGRAIETV